MKNKENKKIFEAFSNLMTSESSFELNLILAKNLGESKIRLRIINTLDNDIMYHMIFDINAEEANNLGYAVASLPYKKIESSLLSWNTKETIIRPYFVFKKYDPKIELEKEVVYLKESLESILAEGVLKDLQLKIL